ncbi:DUF4157 domain-containing protein [uncultured Aquimarina sp.]|uniref:eCIS core domain-containing protein n=1 Tax=uncultured Aquimarina sp. TaxID=575652 RepID=UPI002628A704|nr:DUF4157 domain-containing protein [uncultured Aquimarina sp.]
MKTQISKSVEKDTTLNKKPESNSDNNQGIAAITDNRFFTKGHRNLIHAMHTPNRSKPIIQRQCRTGLPDKLRNGIEQLSGYSLEDTKVHYNSSKPAQLQAKAYAQGNDIYLAPGQEKHLPHEAWHVVQQKQGRVQPKLQMKGKFAVNDDDELEKEADYMGEKAQLSDFKSDPRTIKKKENHEVKKVIQPIWDTNTAYQKIEESANGPASEIIPTNIEVQQDAKDDNNGEQMRNSQKFSAVGYEFEFAQLGSRDQNTEFGKMSHLELAEGESFPLFPNIPLKFETDMGAAIELVMPPILIPRDPGSKIVNKTWMKKVMLKLEGGLKGLAKNNTRNLPSILKAVQLFLGLSKEIKITSSYKNVSYERYGFMHKNSYLQNRHTTAQANVVTSLEEAIKLAYNKEELPEEIEEVRKLFLKGLPNEYHSQTKGYDIFIAQKISEIPYMFFDSLHAKSLNELNTYSEDDTTDTPTFNVLKTLVGHEGNEDEQDKVHERRRTENQDFTKHAARSLVSRVKDRGYAWIKSTLSEQVKKFPNELKIAGLSLLSKEKEDLKKALQNNVAYRTMKQYAKTNPAFDFEPQYDSFVKQAIEHYKNVFEELPPFFEDEKNKVKNTKEQVINPDVRSLMTSARPDTMIYLDNNDVAYKTNEQNDAVLVEIRKPTDVLDIHLSERTTNLRPDDLPTAILLAQKELEYYTDEKWIEGYKEAHSLVNNDEQVNKEKEILEILADSSEKGSKKRWLLWFKRKLGFINLKKHSYWESLLKK